MKVAKITAVNTSAKGKVYGTLASGAVVFGRKDMKFEVGNYIIYNETFQTQDAEGTELETPIPINSIASVWKDKTAAIEAKAESELLEVEEALVIRKAKAKLEKEFSLEGLTETV